MIFNSLYLTKTDFNKDSIKNSKLFWLWRVEAITCKATNIKLLSLSFTTIFINVWIQRVKVFNKSD